MNITTIIELENQEVEAMTGAKLIFAQEQIDDNIIETCVECLKLKDSDATLSTDDAMETVFRRLQQQGIIPPNVEEFSYQMPSCERIKNTADGKTDIPQKVILSFMA
ncbi:hypothetical protein RCG24_10290 [Neobacillus sp. OS1-32]|uniref:Uncharacterized protein n=1 Tax=Neobacillus paridis TaxID=2803862 RepID=A0ABS1TSM1_9BACI|nr:MULTISPECIES: hypothetical protein [Neobacillus]MBL4954306.1 hypothetical protein [Neobacillus paridis]WML32190.1 hypothetical protein RCG24_10290 [Neobacillus sp. OS1-32]